MAKTASISIETLHQLLRCDAEAGKLYWKPRPREMFGSLKAFRTWEARFSGKQAFTARNKNGYHHGCILYKYFVAHRVIWALTYGEWPSDHMDHINHVRTDNRISNLRIVSNAENHKNCKLSSTNTSGQAGVDWSKKDKVWRARINVRRKSIPLGFFKSKAEAIKARQDAETKYGFHKNHGLPEQASQS